MPNPISDASIILKDRASVPISARSVTWLSIGMKIPKYLDEYDFRARFVPSIIVTLPIISAIIALFPPARQLYGFLIGPVLEAVLVLVLVRLARDEGKRIKPQLIKR
jgi:hypothetical protein